MKKPVGLLLVPLHRDSYCEVVFMQETDAEVLWVYGFESHTNVSILGHL